MTTLLKPLFLGPPVWRVAAAESLTVGRVQARIGAESGSSGYFVGGITAYTLEAKVKHLGVDRGEAVRTACVSARVAEEMAVGVCRLFGVDFGVSTTGWAEPDPSVGVAHPFAWWGIAHCDPASGAALELLSGRIELPGASRSEAQAQVADHVIDQLAKRVRQLRG
ncbi:MAG: nicotinamide-nucleotide amidohydrolase family protein [Opitutaceae bacterium]|nr:nicotinamide-nucleotide amidohydrolase family protein [Opitutaceae bacterium]